MASTTSTIRILFDGAVDGLRRAVRAAESDLNRLNDGLERNREHLETFNRVGDGVGRTVATMSKAFLSLGGAANAIQGVAVVAGTLASVTAELAPAALALPGIFLGVGVAAGTAKLALEGVSEAIKGDAEALAQLSPAARDSVKAIQGLADGFNKMKSAVQEDFFAGLAFDIKATGAELLRVGTIYLPKVASGFNAMAVEALRAARSPKFLADLGVIAENTAIGLGKMKNTLANVISGFVGLGAVGSKFLPAIGRAIDDVARRFNDWVQKGINDRSIERMIDRAIQGFKTLGQILVDVGDTFGVVLRAFNEGLNGGGGTLESIERITSALEELASSGTAQAFFKALGETVRVLGDTFRNVLAVAVRELGPIFVELAPFVQEVIRQFGIALVAAIKTVGPLLRDLARFLSENKDAIAPLVPLLLPLAAGFKAVGLAIAAVKGLAALTAAISAIQAAIAAGGLAGRLSTLALAIGRFIFKVGAFAGLALFAKYIDEINIAAVGGDPEKLEGMSDSLHNLVGAGEALASGDFSGILKDIGVEWDTLIQKFKDGESPAGESAQNINKFFDDLEIGLQDSLKKINESFQRDFIDFFANLPANLAENFTILKDTLVLNAELAFEEFKTKVKTKLEEINLAIKDFFTLPTPTEVGEWVGQLVIDFLNGFATLAEDTKLKLDETSEKIKTWVTVDVPNAFTDLAETLKTKASEGWEAFKTACAEKMDDIVAFVLGLPARIGGAIAALPGILLKAALDAWNSFFGETKEGGDNSVKETGTVPDRSGTAVSGLVKVLVDKAKAAWDGLVAEFFAGIARAVGVALSLPGRVLSAIGNLGSTLISSGESLIQGFIQGIENKIPGIRDAAARAAAAARAFFPGSPAKEGPFSGRGYILFSGQALSRDFATGIRQNTPLVAAATAALAAAAQGSLSSFEASQLARVGAQSAARLALGNAVTQVSAVASREQPAPVTNVTVLLSREQIAEIARVVVDNSQRETARKVTAGFGTTF